MTLNLLPELPAGWSWVIEPDNYVINYPLDTLLGRNMPTLKLRLMAVGGEALRSRQLVDSAKFENHEEMEKQGYIQTGMSWDTVESSSIRIVAVKTITDHDEIARIASAMLGTVRAERKRQEEADREFAERKALLEGLVGVYPPKVFTKTEEKVKEEEN